MDLQSAGARSGVLLIDLVDHTLDVGSGRNGNLIIDDHRRWVSKWTVSPRCTVLVWMGTMSESAMRVPAGTVIS